MKIKLDEGYVLNGDAYNYWLSKIYKPEGKKEYERLCSGYFRNVEDVFADALERGIADNQAESFADMIKHMNRVRRDLKKAAKGLNEQFGKRGGVQ